MKIKPIVIGIAGTAQSGKDTAASMINYILHKGIIKADYYDWLEKEESYKNSVRIIHFADKLKEYCSEIFNIPFNYFNNSDYKDNYVYCISYNEFIKRSDLENNDRYGEVFITSLESTNNNLMDARRLINSTGRVSVISLRTILQYIGTNIFRNMISKDIWIDMCINKAKDCSDNGWCIIPDVRFNNENDAIHNISDRKGITIKLIRNKKINKGNEHESEKIDFDTDYEIENNDTKMVLFYKLQLLLKEILK